MKMNLTDDHKKQITNIVASILTVAASAGNPLAIAGATVTAGGAIYEFFKTHPDEKLIERLSSQIEEIDNPDPDSITSDRFNNMLEITSKKIEQKSKENQLINYITEPENLFNDVWNEITDGVLVQDESTRKAKGYYQRILRIISNNIELSKLEIQRIILEILDSLQDIPDNIQSCLKSKSDEIKQYIEEFNRKNDEIFQTLMQAIHSLRMNEQNQPMAKISLHSDNRYYIKLFQTSLFLDKDNPNITLRNMFIPPLVQDGAQSAVDSISEWYSSDIPCMILYGDAGIGKSSLVAKILSQECEENAPNPESVHAIALRKHVDIFTDNLKDGYSPIDDVLCKLFKVDDSSDLANKLLILDGFDELTVLVSEFHDKAAKFIQNLASACKTDNIHVLITSRKDYFDLKHQPNIIKVETLCWKAQQVEDWCMLYGSLNLACFEWCSVFPQKYRNLFQEKEDDQRFKVLCIPFILYLCCNSKIELDKEKSLCQIYDESFRTLLLRAHGKDLPGFERLDSSLADRRRCIIYWQYAKELAYQMFLRNTLDLSDACNPNDRKYIGLQSAKKRTVSFLKEAFPAQFNELKEDDLRTTTFLSIFHFARSEDENYCGITFAHKTVYEYFTAVKLYEDYFAKFNNSYYKNADINIIAQDLIDSAITAFRYKATPPEIFQYLCGMSKAPFNYFTDTQDEIFDTNCFRKAFVQAINKALS